MLVGRKETKRYRPSRQELRTRRALVAHLRPQYPANAPGILAEIRKHPDFKGKPVDLNDIFHDLAYIQRHAGDYIACEFMPNIALEFQEYVSLCKMVVGEALRRYKEGETETRVAETPKGIVKTVIHRESSHHWLRLSAEAQKAIVFASTYGPVLKTAAQVMADYKRLKNLEQRGSLQLVTT